LQVLIVEFKRAELVGMHNDAEKQDGGHTDQRVQILIVLVFNRLVEVDRLQIDPQKGCVRDKVFELESKDF